MSRAEHVSEVEIRAEQVKNRVSGSGAVSGKTGRSVSGP